MAADTISESEVISWLQVALEKELLTNISVKLFGGSENGGGYIGDVLFATVTGTDEKNKQKTYNFVLKCSKSDRALLERTPTMLDACRNESFFYDKVFPIFTKFQLERGIDKPFDSVAKCYGVFDSEFRNVVILENLEKLNYSVWELKKPLTRKHIDLVLKNYGKLHAISVAMQEQEPEKYQNLTVGFKNVLYDFYNKTEFPRVMEQNIEEIYQLLKNDLNNHIMEKWYNFKLEVFQYIKNLYKDVEGLEVIIHGDCWNNNFMFKYDDRDRTQPSKVAFLDWQLSKISSPVFDLAYFLFCCASGEDIKEMEGILKTYYKFFTSYLTRLGSNFASKYSFEMLLNDWVKYGKFGILMCMIPIKAGLTEKKNIPDITKSAEKGEDVSASFYFSVNDPEAFKKRIQPIVKYGAESGLL